MLAYNAMQLTGWSYDYPNADGEGISYTINVLGQDAAKLQKQNEEQAAAQAGYE